MGPIQWIPHHGSGWAPEKLPERLRATYSKKDGVRYLFRAYDVHADRLHGRLRAHKNAVEVLGFYRQIPMRYDRRLRIYLIADNLSTHKIPAIRQWADNSNVELLFTPTYASFLNHIECHFWPIGKFVINNADYPNWDALAKAMADHIRYRNAPHRDQRLIKAERRLLIAPDPCGFRSNVAGRPTRRTDEAIELGQRMFADRDRVLGPEHPEHAARPRQPSGASCRFVHLCR
jgi:transposase